MLGKLTKWLRVMGIDVIYDPRASDAQLLSWAKGGERLILTRDRHLLSRRGPVPGFYIQSDYYHEQVRQVVRAFHQGECLQVFSRCLRCNELLGEIAPALAAGRVPPYVYETQRTFKHCVTCGRFYWGGTHRDQMLRQLEVMLRGLVEKTQLVRPS
jgi:uncharacterized protein with PIN domain